jgi:hypothetical protein
METDKIRDKIHLKEVLDSFLMAAGYYIPHTFTAQ